MGFYFFGRLHTGVQLIEEDPNHKRSWVWSKESNYAIGQVVTYVGKIERQRLEIERSIKQYHQMEIFMLKPRADILIGQNDNWASEKKEGLKNSIITCVV